MSRRSSVRSLLDAVARLRAPQGCAWNRAQTPATVASYTVEEAYEVAQAAEAQDPARLREELGDLLFHVALHAQMAQEAGWFDFAGVAAAAVDKLESRYPHVFGAGEPPRAAGSWEAAKAAGRARIDEGLPPRLPALMAACKLQKRAAAVGFDWPDCAGPRAKVAEELDEIRDAADPAARAAEVGDLLFAAVNLARHLAVEPEQALRAANRKFVRRFRYIEERLAAQGRRAEEVGLAELDALWEEAKKNEAASAGGSA